ncbi:MAG: MFS transporter [Geminicoccaceae bacterium]
MASASVAGGTREHHVEVTVFAVIAAVSFCHMLNDTWQSLMIAVYPLLKQTYALTFAQVGLITLAFQLTASVLQPMIGLYTDKHPKPYSLVLGAGLSFCGLLLLANAHSYHVVLLAAALVGTGSSVFHPDSSRVARLAAGARPGLAQSLFQVGGNLGSSLGPLLAAFFVMPHGQGAIAWFSLLALAAMIVLWQVGTWYKNHRIATAGRKAPPPVNLSPRRVKISLVLLALLMFSKFFYMASLSSYYSFYLMSKFGLSAEQAQLYLFLFLFAVACGTVIGGPLGDHFGRKRVIWASILGVLPFTLLMPYVGLAATAALSVVIGLCLASAFPAIVVYGQELMPGKTGMVSGLFFGLAFGLGGTGAALLGWLADHTSIVFVYKVCSFLPLIGLLTAFLPDLGGRRGRKLPAPAAETRPAAA